MLRDVGHDLERRRQVPRQHVEVSARALAARAAAERRAQGAERVLDLERLARRRSQVDRRHREVGDARLAGRIADRAGLVTSVTLTFGRSCRSTTITSRPLASFAVCAVGRRERTVGAERRHHGPIERHRVRRAALTSRDGSG